MHTTNLKTYQQLLQQLKHCQSEIDYTRYLDNKKDYRWVIEKHARLQDWHIQLQQNIADIKSHSQALQDAVTQHASHTASLQALEFSIDQLIELHTEIARSYAHQANLMEGRYLILHAAGACLDQISLQINEFRYQLGQYLFACNKQNQTEDIELSVVFTLAVETEMAAFQEWSSHFPARS